MLASTVFAFHARWTLTDLILFNEMIHDNDDDTPAAVTVATNGNDDYDC